MKKKLLKRIWSVLLALVLCFTMLPTEGLVVQAATGDVTKYGLTVSGGTEGVDFAWGKQAVTRDDGEVSENTFSVLTILTDTQLYISGTSWAPVDFTTQNYPDDYGCGFYVPEGVSANVVLNEASIYGGLYAAPITVAGTLKLGLRGENTLTPYASSYSSTPGIWVMDTGSLTVYDEYNGSLNITSDISNPAIGQQEGLDMSAGKITIEGGTLNLHAMGNTDERGSSYVSGAAIGGAGLDSAFTEIVINGGVINARSDNGAAIGSGFSVYSQGGKITITGGTVNAETWEPAGLYWGTLYPSSSPIGATGGRTIDSLVITGGTVNMLNRDRAGVVQEELHLDNRPTDEEGNELYRVQVRFPNETAGSSFGYMSYYPSADVGATLVSEETVIGKLDDDMSGWLWLQEGALLTSFDVFYKEEGQMYGDYRENKGSLLVEANDENVGAFRPVLEGGWICSVKADPNMEHATVEFLGETEDLPDKANVYFRLKPELGYAIKGIGVSENPTEINTAYITHVEDDLYYITLGNKYTLYVTMQKVEVDAEIDLAQGPVHFGWNSQGWRYVTYYKDGEMVTADGIPANYAYKIVQSDSATAATTNSITIENWDTAGDNLPLLLTIKDLNMDADTESGTTITLEKSLIDINGSTVELTLEGENKLNSDTTSVAKVAMVGVDGTSTLTITEESDEGKLDAQIDNTIAAIIGGDYDYRATEATTGVINIEGGNISAAINVRSYGAAIGSGSYGVGGAVNITGGTIVADGAGDTNDDTDSYGTGIGAGEDADTTNGMKVTITGGEVTAKADKYVAIGGPGSVVEIHGGKVKAVNSSTSAYACLGNGSSVKITGGELTAEGNHGIGWCKTEITGGTVDVTAGYGVGIGSGTTTISGGKVTASARGMYPAIGSGDVTITGTAEVTATHTGEGVNGSGAAIGAKYTGTSTYTERTITIGGNAVVTAEYTSTTDVDGAAIGAAYEASKVTVNIQDNATVTATSNGYGAAIGGGRGSGSDYMYRSTAEVNISGGTVSATQTNVENGGAAIGSGFNNSYSEVTISGGVVTATGTYGKDIGGGELGGDYFPGVISILGGTVNPTRGYVGGLSSSGSITITGGSISNITTDTTINKAQPKNGAAEPVNVYKITADLSETLGKNALVSTEAAAASITDYDYGFTDVYTDSEGKIYLWLPENEADTVTRATFAGDAYEGTVATTNDAEFSCAHGDYDENGKCMVCGYECLHESVTGNVCEACGLTFVALVADSNQEQYYYTDMAEALAYVNALNASASLTLLADYTGDLEVNRYDAEADETITESLTIWLNDYTLTGDIKVSGSENDLYLNSTGTLDGSIELRNGAQITVNNSTITGGITGVENGQIYLFGTASIGETIVSDGGMIRLAGSPTLNADTAIELKNGATIVVYSGFDTDSSYKVKVSGNDYKVAEGVGITLTEDNFVSTQGYASVIKDDGKLYFVCMHETQDANGSCSICSKPVVAKVTAEDSDEVVYYTDLQEALDAEALTSETENMVTLLQDVEGVYEVSQNLTLDMNGHSITNAVTDYVAIYLDEDAELTLCGEGSIDSVTDGIYVYTGTLVLKGQTPAILAGEDYADLYIESGSIYVAEDFTIDGEDTYSVALPEGYISFGYLFDEIDSDNVNHFISADDSYEVYVSFMGALCLGEFVDIEIDGVNYHCLIEERTLPIYFTETIFGQYGVPISVYGYDGSDDDSFAIVTGDKIILHNMENIDYYITGCEVILSGENTGELSFGGGETESETEASELSGSGSFEGSICLGAYSSLTIGEGVEILISEGNTLSINSEVAYAGKLVNNGTLTVASEDALSGWNVAYPMSGTGKFVLLDGQVTEAMIVVPTDLVYDGTDLTQDAKDGISLDITKAATKVLYSATWTKLFDEDNWYMEINDADGNEVGVEDAGEYYATYKNDADMLSVAKAFQVAKAEITDVTVTLESVEAPVANEAVQTGVTADTGYTAELSWDCAYGYYEFDKAYTATLTLTTEDNYVFGSDMEAEGWTIVSSDEAELALTKTFDKTGLQKIDSVFEEPTDMNLEEHMADAAAVIALLPAEVKVMLEAKLATESDNTVMLKAEWSCAEFSTAPNAENTFAWTIPASETDGIYDRAGVELSGTIVVVNPKALAVTITENTENTTTTYSEAPIDLSSLFILDENVGEATYAVIEDSGEGTQTSSQLAVTKAGTFKVTVTTAAQGIYGSGEKTVTLTVKKAKPEVTAPESVAATYGQTLADVELPDGWSWDAPETSLGAVGNHTFAVTYIPEDADNYETATAEVTVSVSQAEGYVVADINREYIYAVGSEGTVSINIAELLKTDRGATTYSLTDNVVAYVENVAVSAEGVLSFVVNDTRKAGDSTTLVVTITSKNYEDVTVKVNITLTDKLTVAEKSGYEVAVSGSNELTYGQSLSELSLNVDTAVFVVKGSEEAVTGTLAWVTPDAVPGVDTTTAQWKFTPDEPTRYTEVTGSVTIMVKQAAPIMAEMPVATAITYGETLAQAVLTGGKAVTAEGTVVEGSFAWSDSTVAPAVADSGKTAYSLVFTPKDTVNYKTVTVSMTVTVNKAQNAPNMPENTMNVAYSVEMISAVTLPEGWVWESGAESTTLTPGAAVNVTAVYNGSDAGNYEKETVVVAITRAACAHVLTDVLYTGEGEKAPTCTETGLGHKECTVCGETVEAGIVEAALGHTGGTATCSKLAVCTRCGKDYGTTNEVHGETELLGVVSASCTVDGYTGDTHCKACGEKLESGEKIVAPGHSYTSEVTKEPTVSEEGERTYTCGTCGDTYTETIEKLPAPSEAPEEPTEAPEEPTEAPTEPTEAPSEPTEAPVEPTEAPSEPTEAPVEPTEAPEEPTEAPSEPTEAPSEPTEAPSEPTEAPSEPTEAPVEPTEAPSEPTEAPSEPTEAPVEPTEAPSEPTEAPSEPTEAPSEPTEAPSEPTEAPSEPTEAPSEPTEAPSEPTEAPSEPTEAPVEPTEVPSEPTEAPSEPTEAPTEPTEAPSEPTEAPSEPTEAPSEPTEAPSEPTEAPSEPTELPAEPTVAPTAAPTQAPTQKPAPAPTQAPVDPGKPFIQDDAGKIGWVVIRGETAIAQEGDTIVVDMNGTTIVPGDVFNDIKGRDITMTFIMGNGLSWTVNGNRITSDKVSDIDFAVKVGTEENPINTIPVEVINKVTGERYYINISLVYDGEFGMTAILNINLDPKNAGLFANLFYYNEQYKNMQFIWADEIDEYGTAHLVFTHASEYTIVIDEGIMQTSVTSPKTGESTLPIGLMMLMMLTMGLTVYVSGKKRNINNQ